MSHYRTAPARERGPRWGATCWVKLYVRHFIRLLERERLDERREQRDYEKRLRAYEAAIAEARDKPFGITLPSIDIDIAIPTLPTLDFSIPKISPRPSKLPPKPMPPPRRVRE